MATVVDPGQLDGLFKEVYGDSVENLVPETARLINDVEFTNSTKVGDSYHQPVILTNEHGVTYAGPDAGAFDLNAANALTMKDASVQGYQMLLRSQISYDAAARAVSGGDKAFESSTGLLVANMAESLGKRLEISMWYGQDGICEFDTEVASTATTITAEATSGSWASGIWSGLEGALVDVYEGASKLNTTGDVTVTTVDTDTQQVVLTAAAADITAISDVLTDGSPATRVVDVHFKGAYGNEMPGVNSIITNTGSLFGIDASAYNLWRSNVSTVTGALNMAKVLDSVSKAVDRGLDEDVKLYVAPSVWATLNSDESDLRRYDSSYTGTKSESGTESIMYHGQNGKIEVVSHNVIKEGDAFVMPTRRWKRIGATDITFRNPGKGGEFFRELETKAGFELRSYLDQSIFCETPARNVKITGFTV